MDAIVSLPAQIVAWLSEREELSDIKFFTEFPPVRKEVPLKRAIVAVGIEDLKITDKFVANNDGVLERQEYCRTANINARLSICVPYSYGGTACHTIFTDIMDALIFHSDLNVTNGRCAEITSDRNTSALVMTGNFDIIADFCPAEVLDSQYYSFLDKELLCGSHIRDGTIHVTQEDKDKWNGYIKCGSYFGNGAASHSVNVGFEPKAVLVFCPDESPARVNASTMQTAAYAGFAAAGYGSIGIEMTSTGFRVKSATAGTSTAALNASGLTYAYVAWK